MPLTSLCGTAPTLPKKTFSLVLYKENIMNVPTVKTGWKRFIGKLQAPIHLVSVRKVPDTLPPFVREQSVAEVAKHAEGRRTSAS